jgi:chemotaxis response regulator CheB
MTAPPRVRVLVVDDDDGYWNVLIALLEASGEFEIVGQAENGAEAIRRAVELVPDVIAMDVRMPNMDASLPPRRSCRRSASRS